MKQKQKEIDEILSQEYIDPAELRSLGLSKHGFLNNKNRRIIWPKLLGLQDDTSSLQKKGESLKDYFSQFSEQEKKQNNPYYEQIQKDISRSMIEYGNAVSDDEIATKRNQLREILNFLFFKKHIFPSDTQKLPDIHYFQGFHDVMSVFLLTLGDEVTLTLGFRLCNCFLKDALQNAAKLDNIVETLKLINVIVGKNCPEISQFLKDQSLDNGDVALSWILTWFVHVIEYDPQNQSPDIIGRIFDAALCSHPLFLHYFAASIIINSKDKLLSLKKKQGGCSFSDVYPFLLNLPKRILIPHPQDDENDYHHIPVSLDDGNDKKKIISLTENEYPQYPELLDSLIKKTKDCMDSFPPELLFDENTKIFKHISKNHSHVVAYPHSWMKKLIKNDKSSSFKSSSKEKEILSGDKHQLTMPKFLAEDEEFSPSAQNSMNDNEVGNVSVVDTILYWTVFGVSVAAIFVLG